MFFSFHIFLVRQNSLYHYHYFNLTHSIIVSVHNCCVLEIEKKNDFTRLLRNFTTKHPYLEHRVHPQNC